MQYCYRNIETKVEFDNHFAPLIFWPTVSVGHAFKRIHTKNTTSESVYAAFFTINFFMFQYFEYLKKQEQRYVCIYLKT